MSVKNQIRGLLNLYSLYSETTADFSDGKDLDGFLTSFFLTFLNPGFDLHELAKGPTKNSLQSNFFNFV